MRYCYQNENDLHLKPSEWNKNSGKEVLQYAVGGLLYMPATTTKIAKEIIQKRYPHLKAMTLCLEDSIGDDMVGKAELSVKEIAKTLKKAIDSGEITVNDLPLIFIRVRKPGHMKHMAELLGDRMSVITGFVIPKFDKTNCKEYRNEFVEIATNLPDKIYMMPIIESRNAMFCQLRDENLIYVNDCLKPIADYVLNVRVGAADFCNIYGIRRGIDSTLHDIRVVANCLSDIINVFERNYVVSSGVWEYFGDGYDQAWDIGLRRELKLDRLNGFIGKTAIHPIQLPVIQESLIVTYEQYMDALNIMGMSTDLVGVTKGYGGNKMNEAKTHGNWARKILCLASIYGVKKEGIK